MADRTLQERFTEALVAIGEKPVHTASRKWTQITKTQMFIGVPDCPVLMPVPRHNNRYPMYYYLGKAGSIRYGRTYTKSIPCPVSVVHHLLMIAR